MMKLFTPSRYAVLVVGFICVTFSTSLITSTCALSIKKRLLMFSGIECNMEVLSYLNMLIQEARKRNVSLEDVMKATPPENLVQAAAEKTANFKRSRSTKRDRETAELSQYMETLKSTADREGLTAQDVLKCLPPHDAVKAAKKKKTENERSKTRPLLHNWDKYLRDYVMSLDTNSNTFWTKSSKETRAWTRAIWKELVMAMSDWDYESYAEMSNSASFGVHFQNSIKRISEFQFKQVESEQKGDDLDFGKNFSEMVKKWKELRTIRAESRIPANASEVLKNWDGLMSKELGSINGFSDGSFDRLKKSFSSENVLQNYQDLLSASTTEEVGITQAANANPAEQYKSNQQQIAQLQADNAALEKLF